MTRSRLRKLVRLIRAGKKPLADLSPLQLARVAERIAREDKSRG